MNKNIRDIYDQVAQECIDECFILNGNPSTIPWQWEEKFAKAIVEKCLDMMPMCVEQNQIKYYFGLDTPEAQYKRFIALDTEKLKANKWQTVSSSQWVVLHEKFKDRVCIDNSSGTHCDDVTYEDGDMLYNLTYENGHHLPIDTQKKPK